MSGPESGSNDVVSAAPGTGTGTEQPATSVDGYGERLERTVAERGHLCLGIDPHPGLLEDWGLPRSAEGVREFSARVVEAGGDLAAAIKPQVAFFEAYGSAGMRVLEDVCRDIAARGALVIADAKRGDIGSTLAAYAEAWLAPGAPFACDAVTLSPYLGVGALEPAFAAAEASGRGVYVLSATSNPEAVGLQNARLADLTTSAEDASGITTGQTLAQFVADEIAARNRAGRKPENPAVGLVIGATVAEPPAVGRDHGPLLVPGYGAQGGGDSDIRRVCGGNLPSALINVSRAILRHGPDVAALREATIAVNQQMSAVEKSE
ncbi:orotidine-5'-phosphate decarboxylase [Dietzia sp.]|uniref:orotidine-5'-phosphate decarboxylase n=1 Tax=Dietzia sp. TaxID=1871616 RepID=UPI002FDAED51